MSIEELDYQWEWLKRYFTDMIHAVEKTREDGKERGFFITQAPITQISPTVTLDVKRTRVQVGASSRLILKMKDIADMQWDDNLISFHTHVCSGHDYPSTIDKRTAIALGEWLTAIGYVDDPYVEAPHIKVWRIYRKWNNRVGARYRFKF